MKGQIAHINGKRDDNREENLAYLCLDHHDEYDGTTSQSKGLTPGELRYYKSRLEEIESRRGRQSTEDGLIHVTSDFGELDEKAIDALLKSVVSLSLTNRPVVLKNRVGEDKIVVSLGSDDLAALMKADDCGVLRKCKVKSVKPVFSETARVFKFYPEYPMLNTFSKSDTIRLFKSSQYQNGFDYRHFNWRVRCYVPPNRKTVAVITIGTSSGEQTQLTESLIVRDEDVNCWCPDRPIELLQDFLARFGSRLSTTSYGAMSLLINKEFTHIHLPQRSVFDEVFALVDVADRDNALTFFHSELAGNGKLHLLHLFAVPANIVNQMRSIAKNETWF